MEQGFVDGLHERGIRLGQLWREIESGNHEGLPELHRMLHSLAGSAATFGHDEIGEAAHGFEISLEPLLKGEALPQQADITCLGAKLAELHQAMSRVTGRLYNPDSPDMTAKHNGLRVSSGKQDAAPVLVHMLEGDEAYASELRQQLEPFGYRLETFPTPRELCAANASRMPDVVILDRDQADPGGQGGKLLKKLMVRCAIEVPSVVISSQQDFQSRLEAVRAGGKAFLDKPVEIDTLVEALDKLARVSTEEPVRVLIIDDSVSQAEYYASVLQKTGMNTRVMNRPDQAFETIEDFMPDIILMDMYMPECNGLELASVIRQQPVYLSIPIVFLSSETDVDLQLEAMRHGGDDFLVKPIRADHLVSSIESRVERSRLLRNLMVRDSLTGLYNHTTIKEYLDREIHRAERNGTPLSFVMLDIDHFKRVNDRHGHGSGDHVIKGLARMLVKRLRRADLVGRYGGEEFAVILPETDVDHAVRVVESLRGIFSKLVFQSDAGRFSVSFSAGVSGYPDFSAPNQVMEMADQALYRAKKEGRNRVCRIP